VSHLVAKQLFEIPVHSSALHSHEIQRRSQQVAIVAVETAALTKVEGVAVDRVVRNELESVWSAFLILSLAASVFRNVDLALQVEAGPFVAYERVRFVKGLRVRLTEGLHVGDRTGAVVGHCVRNLNLTVHGLNVRVRRLGVSFFDTRLFLRQGLVIRGSCCGSGGVRVGKDNAHGVNVCQYGHIT
jgi:hypothetical protein